MTRLQAVLLLAVLLAALSLRQNIRWPAGLWDAPAFRTFRFEELPEVAKLLAQKKDVPENPPPIPPDATPASDDKKPVVAEEKKPKKRRK